MNDAQVIRNGEDLSDYFIGNFGDTRLARIGALLLKRMCNSLTTCIKRLGKDRATEVAFGRFLRNEQTTVEEISNTLARKTNDHCENIKHVLCIQDTVESTYPTQALKKSKFGPTSNNNTLGFFAHLGLMIDAETKDILGVSNIMAWIRTEAALENVKNKKRPIEEKESIRWIDTINNTKKVITNAERITAIGDRENDFFEFIDRVPDKLTDIIIRVKNNRELSNGKRLFEHMDEQEAIGEYELELPAITGKRKARFATIKVKKSKVTINKPDNISDDAQDEITLTCIEAIEVGTTPRGEDPVHWRLLTTHEVNNFSKSYQIIQWYTYRWIIEQLFRTMKNKGLHIEDSEIETPKELLNMFVIGLVAAVKVLTLVYSRDGKTKRLATDIFNEDEIFCLMALLKTLEGKTKRQQNPHTLKSLSWASWIIARLGSWHSYGNPPGPITMYRGLKIFEERYYGWSLARKDVCMR